MSDGRKEMWLRKLKQHLCIVIFLSIFFRPAKKQGEISILVKIYHVI